MIGGGGGGGGGGEQNMRGMCPLLKLKLPPFYKVNGKFIATRIICTCSCCTCVALSVEKKNFLFRSGGGGGGGGGATAPPAPHLNMALFQSYDAVSRE